jgi:putative FmdB family regulatory protein
MPIYEYGCKDCRAITPKLVRRVSSKPAKPVCSRCGGKNVARIISRFAFHQSMLSKLEQLDPKYDKMIDASNPDLSFDNLVKKYRLDEPVAKTPDD